MLIKNPTSNKVHIVVKGEYFEIAPEGIENVPNKVGEVWLNTHQFLQVVNESETVDAIKQPVEEEKEVVEVETASAPEEVIEETIEPKVKKSKKSKK